MQFTLRDETSKRPENGNVARSKERFRLRFTRVLAACVRRQFSLEESFGLAFEETLERVPLTQHEQTEVYHELLTMAKESPEFLPAVSMGGFEESASRHATASCRL